MNISLIGMSGAGKSHIGAQVADALGLTFTDVDRLLEELAGKPLPQLIEELGEDGFSRVETAATEKMCEGTDLLISTGGSIVYSESAMETLREYSRVIYMRVSKPTLLKRIQRDRTRETRIIGLKEKSLDELIDERTPLYEQYAHTVIDAETGGEENIVARIVEAALTR
ncbi:MAG: shikimate kinase [Candidatus Pacebacteria bacterium]|nr:shikimate kinase [Candidatus Paceibacterota bacterium]